MPWGAVCFGGYDAEERRKVGRPKRDRSRNKAQRKARKRGRR